jgi:flagellar basal body-associated protein FliL
MAKEEAKSEKSAETPAAAAASASGAKPKGKAGTFAVFGGVMLIEGLAIFAGMKFLGSEPDPTHGMQEMVPTTKPWEESKELAIAQVRVPNNNGARTVLYSVKIVLRVHHDDATKVKEFMENRKNTIDDLVGRVIRSADEKHFAEPGLETLKRQIGFELSTLLGDEHVIEQVLIPECTPLPAGF